MVLGPDYGFWILNSRKHCIKVDSLVEWSDAHNGPHDFREEPVLLYGKANGHILVDNGDGPDMLIYGKDAFQAWADKVHEALDGEPIFMTDSNHAPMPWLKELFATTPGVNIARFWEFELPWGIVHVRHGHEWFIDWYFLRWIAPPVTHFMTDHFPKLWHKIALNMGWMPGTGPITEERYHIVVQRIHARAVGFALKRSKELRKNVMVLTAHTHAIVKYEGAFHGELRVLHADSGTVAIGSYCEVKDNVELKRV